jgi:hypothetical protein
MNVASRELCEELYELSGWTSQAYESGGIEKAWRPTPLISAENYRLITIGPNTPEDIPAYGLGYLLRKLPEISMLWQQDGKWHCDLEDAYMCEAHTPEDAACKLCIELFKQGILSDTMATSDEERVR